MEIDLKPVTPDSLEPMKKTYPRSIRFTRSAVFSAILFTQVASNSVFAVTYYWDNDGATAGFGTADGTWAVPTAGSATQGWSTSATGEEVPAEVTTTSADVLNFGNGATGLAAGTITVNGTVDGSGLTFASGSGAITLSGGTVALGGNRTITAQNHNNTIGSNIQFVGGNGTISFSRNTAAGGTMTINGEISGTGNLTFTTPNVSSGGNNQVILLGAANSYTGNTTITTGNVNNATTIRCGVDDALPTTTVLTLNGGNGNGSGRTVTFDLNGKNQTLAGLTNNISTLTARNQRVSSTAAATLTIDNSLNYTFGGAGVSTTFNGNPVNPTAQITGAISLAKSGAGTFTLLGSQGYTGATNINAGKLVGVVGGHCQNSEMRLNEALATLGVSINDNTKSWRCAALTATAAGTLEFNFGAITPSDAVSPLVVTAGANGTGVADFTATPAVSVVADAGLPPGTYPLMTWDSSTGTVPTTANLTVSPLKFGTVASLQLSGNTLNLVITSTIVPIVKANNANNLDLGSSWVGGTAPGAGDVAIWNSTVTSANSTVLGSDLTWAGLVIENPAGLVTIGAGSTLTVGAADTDIDLRAATADLTLNCGLALSDANTWDVAAGRTLTVAGGVSGGFGITKNGEGTAVLSGSNTYSGNTTVSAGLLKLAGAELIPNGTGNGNVSVGGTLDLNGFSETINGLNGSGIVDNVPAGPAVTLTVGDNDASSSFSGILQNSGGTLNLVKTGSGVAALGGANTISGTVTVNGGTLALDHINPLDSVSGIAMGADTTLRPKLTGTVVTAPITLGPVDSNVTITAPLFPDNNTGATTPKIVEFQGEISGDGNLTLLGINSFNQYGTINLSAANTYGGSTLLDCVGPNMNIFVNLGTENALPVTTVLTLDGGAGTGSAPGRYCELDLNGYDQTLAGLTNVEGLPLRVQRIRNSSTFATLTVNNAADFTFSGLLGSGGADMGLTKSGAGVLTLAGANTYTGATTITGGTLALGANNVLADTTAVTIGGGSLRIGNGFADAVDTLDVTAAATITVGAGASLAFADSSGKAWAGSLTITGAFVSGASLRFGTDANGLTPAQIAKISGPGLSDIAIDSQGYITATVTGGYNVWAITNAGGQGPELDFDNDGVANGVEYFMNAAAGFTANPVLNGSNTVTWTNGGNIPAAGYGTQFVVQTSSNLVNWSNVPIGELTTNTDGPGGSLSYTLTGTAPRFVRLVVTPD
jgi:autotransporter-associated beta strand protein